MGEKRTTSSANISINKLILRRLIIGTLEERVLPDNAVNIYEYTRSKYRLNNKGLQEQPCFNPNRIGMVVKKGSDLMYATKSTYSVYNAEINSVGICN